MTLYSKTTWKNGQAPALDETNLNKMEAGIEAACAQSDLGAMDVVYAAVAPKARCLYIPAIHDTDLGAWRQRCGGLSWYNEAVPSGVYLGKFADRAAAVAAGGVENDWYERTGTVQFFKLTAASETEIFRAGSQDFPAAVDIVAYSSKVVFRDLTRKGAPMWMVFLAVGASFSGHGYIGPSSAANITSIVMHDGLLVVGHASGIGMYLVNFLAETSECLRYSNEDGLRGFHNVPGIANRNSTTGEHHGTLRATAHNYINDVAITALSDAPIDHYTGLPVQTIAASTDGGVSVINDDGTVADLTSSAGTNSWRDCALDDYGNLVAHYSNTREFWLWTPTDYASDGVGTYSQKYLETSIPAVYLLSQGTTIAGVVALDKANYALGRDSVNDAGITLLAADLATQANGMVAYITSTYNTGWMPGDIKGCWLCDSAAETIGVDESTEYHDDGNAASDNYGNEANSTTGWGQVGLDQGANIFQSQGAVVDTGSYAFEADANDTPTGGALFYKRIGLDFGLTAGKMYKLSFAGRHKGTGDVWHAVLSSGLAAYQNKICILANTDTTFQDFEVVFRHDSDTEYFIFREFSVGNSGGVYFDNFSIIECSDLTENGRFVADWGWSTTGNWAWESDGGFGGRYRHTSGQTYSLYQTMGLVNGKQYIVTFTVGGMTAGTIKAQVGTAAGATRSANGTYVDYLTMDNTSATLYMVPSSDFDGYIDDISVYEVKAYDRSVNNKGLRVHGQITKAAVATGAELMGYSGFLSKNWIEQPYNSSLDTGTGDFFYSIWFKANNSVAEALFYRAYWDGAPSYSGSCLYLMPLDDGTLRFRMTNNGFTTHDTIVSDDSFNDNYWHYVIVVRRGSNIEMWVDGESAASPVAIFNATGSMDNANATLRIGQAQSGAYSLSHGALSLPKAGAYAPSQSQIEKMFRDEKKRFAQNASDLLAGTSDNVTALAYDPLTKQLHAGTSYGRSVFAGLARIASEATAIGAISSLAACDGIIAQGGASGADIYVPAKTLREELARAIDQAAVFGTALESHWDEGDGSTTDFALPAGWKPKFVYNAGALVKEGSADQYTIKFDGFIYTVSFNTAPANNDLCFMAVRRQS